LRGSVVAQNYAEALFELAGRSGELEEYGSLIDATAAAIEASDAVKAVLMSPKVTKAVKSRVLGVALDQVGAPKEFVRYLEAVVKRGRQLMLPAIADSFHQMVDASLNRVRAAVTVARPANAALRDEITAALRRALDKQVIASFTVDPAILGGTVVRVGDRVYDGSIRRKLVRLKRQLIAR
jgi:F-type H+-transporting ATPase subunit delta